MKNRVRRDSLKDIECKNSSTINIPDFPIEKENVVHLSSNEIENQTPLDKSNQHLQDASLVEVSKLILFQQFFI